MKTMIVYASVGGTTLECAEKLAKALGDCELYDLDMGIPYVVDVDAVIIGSYVHMGNISKNVKRFIVQNGKELAADNIAVGIYTCNASLPQADAVLEANFPAWLLEKATAVSSFGGRLGADGLSGLDRLIAKRFRKMYEKTGAPEPKVLDGVIDKFANRFATIKKRCI